MVLYNAAVVRIAPAAAAASANRMEKASDMPDIRAVKQTDAALAPACIHTAGSKELLHSLNGRNPIVAHEFLGSSVEGKDVIIIDDMISSGDSIIEVATELKRRKANRIFAAATFGLFTNGMEKFDEYINGVSTNYGSMVVPVSRG